MKWIPATGRVAERGAVPIRPSVDRPIPHINPVAGQGGPMNPSKSTRRIHRALCATPEVLEDRVVLSAGQGSTFAIMPGTVGIGGKATSVSFKIDPSLFTAPAGSRDKLLIGIDVAPATPSTSTSTSTLKPEIVSITSASGQVTKVEHGTYNAKVAKANKIKLKTTSASLVEVVVPKAGQPANDYTVQVKGLDKTSGQFLLGFFLPGDATGAGTVTQADLKTIKQDNGMTAQNANYNFNADVNRDGIINGQDLSAAKQDMGASTLASPVVSVNLDPASDPAANRTSPYSTVHFAGTVTPNASITFVDNSGGGVSSTTANSSGAYSIIVPLVLGSNTFQVTTSDGFGQSITGAISPVVYSPPTSG